LAELIPRRLINTSPAADECLNTASSWLQNCLEAHVDCSIIPGAPRLLPTRVIDVGLHSDSSPALLVSNGCFGDWVTLSYCWGSVDTIKTTIATLEKFQKSLDLEKLPQLFRDAITLTRHFNYRYLWIDLLCIVQDCNFDWQAEAANMGYIYRNSAFTIAAECASDPTKSILDTHRPTKYSIKLACYSERHQINGFIFPHRMYVGDDSSWKTRAWTLQEDVLSQRVLRCAEKQLEWDCRTLSCSEEDITGDADFNETKGLKHFKRICLSQDALIQKLYHNLDHDLDATICLPFEIWGRILEDFVLRNITYDADRLPAISGVAKEIARHTGYTYKAGLWEQHLQIELLWSTSGNATWLHDHVAPSWSWASLDFSTTGCLLFHESEIGDRHNILKLINVLSVEVSYAGSDEFGRVTSAQLSISGRCREIQHWHKSEKGFRCRLDVGCAGGFSQGLQSLPVDALFMQIIFVEQSLEEVDIDRFSRRGTFKALILQPINRIERKYRRIGVADISLEQGQDWSSRAISIL
jgi:hypothetical protein